MSHEAVRCPVQWKISSLARRANGLDGRHCSAVEKTGHPIRLFLAQGRVDEVVGAAGENCLISVDVAFLVCSEMGPC